MRAQMDVNTNALLERIRVIGPILQVSADEDRFDADLARQLDMPDHEPAELRRAVYALKNEGRLRFTTKQIQLGNAGIIDEPVTEMVIEITIC